MPTVYQRRTRDGAKAENFTADIWIDGHKFPRSLQARTRREAKKEALAVEKQLREELARRHEPLTIDTLMGKYRAFAKDLPSYKWAQYHMLRLVEILGKDKLLAELSNSDRAAGRLHAGARPLGAPRKADKVGQASPAAAGPPRLSGWPQRAARTWPTRSSSASTRVPGTTS